MNQLTARQFRIVLLIILFLLVGGLVAGSVFVQTKLRSYSAEISTQNSQAARSESDIATLRKIEAFLEENQSVEQLAQKVVAESSSYQYQDQIIKDLSAIASESGITITSYGFSEAAAEGATPAGGAAQPGAAATPAPAAPSGLNSKSVSVQIVSPVSYNNLLDFIRRVEQNTTKMQIAGVSMSAAESGQVSSNAFDIKVYVR